MSGCATAPPRAPPEIGHPAGRGYCAPSGAAGRMGPAQCPCLLRQREFPGRLRNGRFFESLPAMGTLPAPFGERCTTAKAAAAAIVVVVVKYICAVAALAEQGRLGSKTPRALRTRLGLVAIEQAGEKARRRPGARANRFLLAAIEGVLGPVGCANTMPGGELK